MGAGADLGISDHRGQSPISYAKMINSSANETKKAAQRKAVVQFLLGAGASDQGPAVSWSHESPGCLIC